MEHKEDLMDNEEQLESAGGPAVSGAEHDARMAWWREARVGLFIHWGLYSIPGGIWKGEEIKATYAEHLMLRARIPAWEYEKLAEELTAERFDAGEWASLAKRVGLKYLIFTAKHHEGFSMYDTALSDYKITSRTPFGRDPLQELAAACREEDVKLCVYYSHAMDWHHPDSQGNTWDYPGNIGAYDEVEGWIGDGDKRSRYEHYLQSFALPQVKELLEKYGPIGLMWFDCGHKLTEEQGAAFLQQVREVQPDCLVNRRVWREPFGDYGNTSDNQPHVRVPRKDWESINTLNDSWGYKVMDTNWKTAEEVLRQMADALSQNGNFVINVGPMGSGAFDPKSIELLEEIGEWMGQNSEAVYGTVESPIGKPAWGRCTRKGSRLYLYILDWPETGRLVIPGLRNPIDRAYMLADPRREELAVSRLSPHDAEIILPSRPTGAVVPVVAVEFAGEPDANPVRLLQAEEQLDAFGAFDAEIAGPSLRYDTGKKDHDNLIHWRHPGDEAQWTFRTIK
ncbi:MAG: alpha-L-fucosidase, partial [Paenibacillaceae bacterium]|nr:alpha-L-fucosidase [Paenibacillaceae bacterium]